MKALNSDELEQVSGGFDFSSFSFDISDFRDFRISPLALNTNSIVTDGSTRASGIPMGVAPPQYAEPVQAESSIGATLPADLGPTGSSPFQLHNVQDEFREALLQDGPERSYATINTGWFRSRFLNR